MPLRALHADSAVNAAALPICPPHPGFLHGMCIRCCARKVESSDGEGDADGEAHVPLTCALAARCVTCSMAY